MMSDLENRVALLDESEIESINKARKSIDWHRRYGRWVAVIYLLTAAVQIGISLFIIYVALHIEHALPGPNRGFLLGLGSGIGIGAVAGYFLVQGLGSFREALGTVRGFPELHLLVKIHDALSARSVDQLMR